MDEKIGGSKILVSFTDVIYLGPYMILKITKENGSDKQSGRISIFVNISWKLWSMLAIAEFNSSRDARWAE